MNAQFLLVDIEASAGTYIKEFVHSDFGRTSPSLGSLLHCEADILQLDVLDVALPLPDEPDYAVMREAHQQQQQQLLAQGKGRPIKGAVRPGSFFMPRT